LLLGGDASLIQFNQFSLDKFQSQNLVNLKGIVSLPIAMSFQDLFQRIGTKVRSTARFRVQKHLPQPPREFIPVPDTEVMELVPAEKQSFEVKWRKGVVKSGYPLRHAIVIGVLCFEHELLIPMQHPINTRNRLKGEATIRSNLSQSCVAISNESQRRPVVQQLCRRLIRQSNEVVIKIWSSIRDLRSFHGKFARHKPRRLLE